MDQVLRIVSEHIAGHIGTKEIKEIFAHWFSMIHQKHISILLTGKTGVGKSRLVNALVGQRVAKEGQAKDPCTNIVTSYIADMEGIEVHIWDSPGLQDGTSNDELYLEDLTKKLHRGMDVMIYCLKMDDRRFHEDDKRAMRTLTRAFGKELWKNAVIALTFANKVKDPDKRDRKAYFLRDLQFWQDAIETFFTNDLKIASTNFNTIPVVPTGNYIKLQLPNGKNWLAELWTKCYLVIKDSAALNLYRINKKRLKFPGSENVAKACGSSESETRNRLPLQAGPSQTNSQSACATNIPTVIPLNQEQRASFWQRTWKMYISFLSSIGSTGSTLVGVANSVMTRIRNFFFDTD